MSHDELFEDIIDAYETKKPLFIWGRTGIGKSYSVKRAGKILAERYDRTYSECVRDLDGEHFVVLDRRLAYRDPTDLIGVLYKDDGVSKWHYPNWLVKLSKQREEKEGIEIRAILFLEEVNLAPQLTQNAAYELVLDRKIEDLELADGVVVIAAGNVAEDRAYTFDLSDPLRTRFTHVTLKTPVFKEEGRKKGWFYWAAENGIDGRILAFLSLKPEMLFYYVENDRTFPTPRGWEMASDLMRNKDNSIAWRAVAKACGYLAGLQFKQFMELSMSVDVEEILRDPKKWLELPPDKVELRFSVIASLTHMCKQNPEKYAEGMLKLAAHLFTGIYDDKTLGEYIKLTIACEGKNREDKLEIERKLRGMEGEREAEFSALILTSVKAVIGEDEFKKLTASSDYAIALIRICKLLS